MVQSRVVGREDMVVMGWETYGGGGGGKIFCRPLRALEYNIGCRRYTDCLGNFGAKTMYRRHRASDFGSGGVQIRSGVCLEWETFFFFFFFFWIPTSFRAD